MSDGMVFTMYTVLGLVCLRYWFWMWPASVPNAKPSIHWMRLPCAKTVASIAAPKRRNALLSGMSRQDVTGTIHCFNCEPMNIKIEKVENKKKRVVPTLTGAVQGKPRAEPVNAWPYCTHKECTFGCRYQEQPVELQPYDGDESSDSDCSVAARQESAKEYVF